MRLFFAVLSAGYIFLIFFLADSAAVNYLGHFNPFSLLHIPLYGVLTVLLFLSIHPEQKSAHKNAYLGAALIAGAVGILDELYQSFLPNREASGGDVLLDLIGIILALFISKRLPAALGRFR
jgi:VanZ family protein